ncbi:hypothetical protein Pint_32632 [Pistacia integerrima]|uniref:Uncharacterized protein n=1 Tax=Pistacia integerrima TaxID=434235 RepID=A0ACC0XQV5_9ROSI|nr:hypothetical protein Pint_32632 [Pistacia integerrima]
MVGIGCMNKNTAVPHCKREKLNIDDTSLSSFTGRDDNCAHLSHYRNAICDCRESMDMDKALSEIMPPSTEAGLSLLRKVGLINGSTTEEKMRCRAISEFNEHKAMLLCPKLASNFGYENHPLGIDENNTNIPNFRFVSSEQIEALRLLVTSFVSESAMAIAFLKETNSEQSR